jgi:hypothetical protein
MAWAQLPVFRGGRDDAAACCPCGPAREPEGITIEHDSKQPELAVIEADRHCAKYGKKAVLVKTTAEAPICLAVLPELQSQRVRLRPPVSGGLAKTANREPCEGLRGSKEAFGQRRCYSAWYIRGSPSFWTWITRSSVGSSALLLKPCIGLPIGSS